MVCAAPPGHKPAHPRILLTGPPGCGKTTVLLRVARGLAARGRPARGFVTREVRGPDGARAGFSIETLGGRARAVLAHVDFRDGPRVGRYGVDVRALDRPIAEELEPPPPPGGAILLDEIGKMECLSPRFVAAVERLLDEAPAPVVATVAARGGGLIARAKARPDVEVWPVSRANRDDLPERILARLG